VKINQRMMKQGHSPKINQSEGLIEKAIRIAVDGHAGQKDKSGQPYILHPLRVMLRGQTEDEKITGVLHDVVEDTTWTLSALKAEGFPRRVLYALDCLTRREIEGYGSFIQRLARNRLARRVKIADLEDNMDARRLASFTPNDGERFAKYLRAWHTLVKLEQR
jgi:(p)ppGpp synthase/HD superfamily hydrolase